MKNVFILGLLDLTTPELYASDLKDIVQTCKTFSVEKASISAECAAENGGTYKTALRLRGVNNYNGKLQFDEDSSTKSEFFETCTNKSIDSSGRLRALCEDGTGQRLWSTLDLKPVLKNYNGTIVYALD